MADELKPVLLSLDLGLDMTTPKPAAASGSLLSCMNYERGAASGLSRIEGYEYYDAQTPADTTSFKIIDLSTTHSLVVGSHVGTLETYYGQVGVIEKLLKHTATESDKLLAVKGVGVPDDSIRYGTAIYGVLEDASRTRTVHVGTVVEIVSPTRIVIAITNNEPLIVGKLLYGLDVIGGAHYSNGSITTISEFNSVVYNVDSNYNYRRQYATTLRNAITSITGAAGLLWLNDILYAVGVKTDITEASVGTFYKCRSIQQLLDDSSGADKVIGWEELDIGTSLQEFPVIGMQEAVNSIPTLKGLELEESRYEFIVANFYGSEKTTKAYGVSGASKAFEFDGKTFNFISTGLPFELDKPRHIAQFKDRLFLAYTNGSVLYSVAGSPLNFDGVSGAGEIAFGDRVVGLQVISGEALAVFCENSIHYIGADLSTHVISPNTGAIEYTITATNKPFYCSANGIMTLEQSDKYGEFVGQSISEKVEPWLRPRLRRVQGRQTAQPSVIGVTIVRAKNQYRVFFKDGYVLTLTATPQGYVYTTQKYTYTSGTFITFASCSQMSSDGTERLFAAHHDPAQPALSKVVEVDAGWGFAGAPIQYYFETNAYYDSPFTYNRISKIRLHGQSKGLTSLKVQSSSTMDAFEEDYNTTQEQYLSLPRKTALYRDDLTYTTDIKDLADRGLGFKLKISGRVTDVTEPPHVCQLLTTLNKTGGKLDV